MKKITAVLFALMTGLVFISPHAMAFNKFLADVNNSCGYDVVTDCVQCHDASGDYSAPAPGKNQYLVEGSCSFCIENQACISGPPTVEELYTDARGVTKNYFETMFGAFMSHLQAAMNDPSSSGDAFADVFPACPEIAPVIASDFSRSTGYMVRRVTERTRNSRNMPDEWELEQLKDFATMAANGEPRNLMAITKPDSNVLPTKEFEAYAVVTEEFGRGKNKVSQSYFRYMRSITMPPHPADTTSVPNPGLPCLLCHGTNDQVSQGVKDALAVHYPYDTAMGYKKGDIRGAWSIKIPLDAVPQ